MPGHHHGTNAFRAHAEPWETPANRPKCRTCLTMTHISKFSALNCLKMKHPSRADREPGIIHPGLVAEGPRSPRPPNVASSFSPQLAIPSGTKNLTRARETLRCNEGANQSRPRVSWRYRRNETIAERPYWWYSRNARSGRLHSLRGLISHGLI